MHKGTRMQKGEEWARGGGVGKAKGWGKVGNRRRRENSAGAATRTTQTFFIVSSHKEDRTRHQATPFSTAFSPFPRPEFSTKWPAGDRPQLM